MRGKDSGPLARALIGNPFFLADRRSDIQSDSRNRANWLPFTREKDPSRLIRALVRNQECGNAGV